MFIFTNHSGERANAAPPLAKILQSRFPHVENSQRSTRPVCAMAKSRFGRTTLLIMVSPLPGKYELAVWLVSTYSSYIWTSLTVPNMKGHQCSHTFIKIQVFKQTTLTKGKNSSWKLYRYRYRFLEITISHGESRTFITISPGYNAVAELPSGFNAST